MGGAVKSRSRDRQIAVKRKGSNKCSNPEEKRALAVIAKQEKILEDLQKAGRRLQSPMTAGKTSVQHPVFRSQDAAAADADSRKARSKQDSAEVRITIKVLFNGLPREQQDEALWDGHGGTISEIRKKMGDAAPDPRTVRGVLKDLAQGETDVASKPNGGGRCPIFTKGEMAVAAECLADGLSQTQALLEVNALRQTANKPLARTRKAVGTAMRECGVQSRRRRTEKVGSTDENGTWAKARDAQCTQFDGQLLRADMERAETAATVAHALVLTTKRAATMAAGLTRSAAERASAALRHAEAKAAAADAAVVAARAAVREIRMPLAPAPVATALQQPAVAVAIATLCCVAPTGATALVPAAAPAPIVCCAPLPNPVVFAPPPIHLDGVLWLDEHHQKCRLGLTSKFDHSIPRGPDGRFLPEEEGGKYTEWRNEKVPKHAKEARGLFGVAMRIAPDGTETGVRMMPYNYTEKTVVGVDNFEKQLRAEVDRVWRECGVKSNKGCWAKHRAGAADLPGKMYEKRYGSGWRTVVVETLRTKGVVCIIELMDHAIAQGNTIFEGTRHAHTWLLYHDHLSQWWEAGAQQHLASRGFKDRQVRCWGDVNYGTTYYQKLTGNSPELMPLDSNLFSDFKIAVSAHVVQTGILPNEDERKFKMGTPKELWSTMERVWEVAPTSERIVQDIMRWPVAVRAIVAARGTIVPELDNRHGRRKAPKPPAHLHPDAHAAAVVRRARNEEILAKYEELDAGNARLTLEEEADEAEGESEA